MDIEYALLADYAEVVNGKLYLVGGGWDLRTAGEAPANARFAVALGVRIAWEETNIPVELTVALEDDDGAGLLRADGRLQVGRPPHLPAGASQLSQAALILGADLPRFGGYRVVVAARLPNGPERVRTLPFRLVPAASPPTA